jgi:hypothetical protein
VKRAIVVGLALAALAAPRDALAQAPTATYAGGFLPSAGKPPPGYQPTVGIALQPRGGQIAVRFDTTIRCGDATLDVAEQRVAPFDGVNLQMTQPLVRSLGGGRRLDATWTLKGSVAVTQASGILRLTGALRGPGRRVRHCTSVTTRPFQARLVAAPTGAPGSPAPPGGGATLYGATAQVLADGLPGAVIVRTTSDGRRGSARWTASAPCDRGAPESLAHLTRPSAVAAGATGGVEQFTVRSGDAVRRYRTEFAAHFTSDGAVGTLRLQVSVFDRSGRSLRARCDSGPVAWTALYAVVINGSLVPPGRVKPGSVKPVRGRFSLRMTSQPGDYIGGGRTWSVAPPAWKMHFGVGPDRRRLVFGFDGPVSSWSASFGPPPGQVLQRGGTYEASRFGFNQTTSGIEVSGDGRACDTVTGTFTVDALSFDRHGALRTALIRFEQHCGNAISAPHPASLRGTLRFRAA